jgi:YgiT-type zinc finger domain-containing protein
MVCDICGKKGARIRRVTRSYGKGDNLLVIENVPVVSCPNCGETYITAETLHENHRVINKSARHCEEETGKAI